MASSAARLVPTAIVGALFAFVGPRLTAPHDKAAGEPFAYEPPAGFDEVKGGNLDAARDGEPTGRKWRLADTTGHVFIPRFIVTHSPNTMTVEESDLAKIAQGMPAEFRASGLEWNERRHETRTRPDGARVGLIEADCSRKAESASPFPMGRTPVDVQFRKLQLVFPDDGGTSIVTADFASEEAATWEPIFEASIAKAKGVATRVPPAPAWMYGGWAAAGLVLGWLASSLIARDAPKKADKADKAKKEEDD